MSITEEMREMVYIGLPKELVVGLAYETYGEKAVKIDIARTERDEGRCATCLDRETCELLKLLEEEESVEK